MNFISIPDLPRLKKNREKGKQYLKNGKVRIWNGRELYCEHKKRPSQCRKCGGVSLCIHEVQKHFCKLCNGSYMCVHGKETRRCKDCGGRDLCQHGIPKHICKKCEGGAICEHKKIRRTCSTCNPLGHFISVLRGRVSSALKNQNASTNEKRIQYMCCTVQEAYKHIENQFTEGMNWQNMGTKPDGTYGWDIDHRKPCASFNFSNEEEKYMCFHWSNLQPMWHIENVRKSAKFDPDTFNYEWKGKDIGWQKIE